MGVLKLAIIRKQNQKKAVASVRTTLFVRTCYLIPDEEKERPNYVFKGLRGEEGDDKGKYHIIDKLRSLDRRGNEAKSGLILFTCRRSVLSDFLSSRGLFGLIWANDVIKESKRLHLTFKLCGLWFFKSLSFFEALK